MDPRHSRYVIDLNRPPENTPMYAGANNTELCPTRSFGGEALYRDGQAPSAAEVQEFLAEVDLLRERHDRLAARVTRLASRLGLPRD